MSSHHLKRNATWLEAVWEYKTIKNSKSKKDSYPYEYWQCFENKKILHTYLEHRFWPIKECQRFNKDAKGIIKGVSHVCFSASFISQKIDSKGKKYMYWNFERIKTSKSCEGRSCEFTQELRKNLCPDLK